MIYLDQPPHVLMGVVSKDDDGLDGLDHFSELATDGDERVDIRPVDAAPIEACGTMLAERCDV